MGNRRKARECALQLLYQLDFGHQPAPVPDTFWAEMEADAEARAFAERLIAGVSDRRLELDACVARYSANWRLPRMAAVDKNILRLAAYELLHCPDIPAKVTINEAVEIAKRFGTTESSAFVNGILDHIAREVRGEGQKGGE